MLELCTLPFVLLLTIISQCFDPAPATDREYESDDWNTRENTEKCAEFWNVPEPMSFPGVEFHDVLEL